MRATNEICNICGKFTLHHNSNCVECSRRKKEEDILIWINSSLHDKVEKLRLRIEELEKRIDSLNATY
jgi:uncharacterized protein YceH (UPF0502 family)